MLLGRGVTVEKAVLFALRERRGLWVRLTLSVVGFGAANALLAVSAGAIAEALSRTPFDHPDPIPLMLMHANEPPPPPRSRTPGLPAELEQVILQCLAKNPDARVPGCVELARRLQAVRDAR